MLLRGTSIGVLPFLARIVKEEMMFKLRMGSN
jgi:hypothetical protein